MSVSFSEADILARLDTEIARLEMLHQAVVSGATEFSSLLDWNLAVNSGAALNYISTITGNTTALRNSLNGLLSPTAVANRLEPYLLNYRDYLDLPNNSSVSDILDEIKQHWIATSQSIAPRTINYGAPVADGSNTGDGLLYRYTTDRYGYPLGFAYTDVKTIKCVDDANTGASKFEERFNITAGAAPDLNLRMISNPSTTSTELRALIAKQGDVIRDANFFTTSDPDSFATEGQAVWQINTGASSDWTIDTTDWYNAQNESAAQCYVVSGNSSLIQQLTNTQGGSIRFSSAQPYHTQISLKPGDNNDGYAFLRLGTIEAVWDLSAISSGSWTVKVFSSGTNCWFDNFNTEDLTIEFGVRNSTTGSCKFSNLLVKQTTPFGNQFYALPSGESRFLTVNPDSFTITDEWTVNDGLYQKWLTFGYPGKTFPQDGSPTISDPSLSVG